KVALITGASRGIGAATARRLAKDGYNIVINYKNSAEAAMRLEDECAGAGAKVLTWQADVANYEQCGIMVNAAIEEFGAIDLLVNNAGITRDGLLVRMSEEQFDDVIAGNLKSAFNLLRLVGEKMFRAKSGKIINISSVVGIAGNAGQVNYAASKAGIIGMTKSAARELGARGITVNAIAPGFIGTDMTDKMPDAAKDAMKKEIALGRIGRPEDIAGAVAFLASSDADYITGQVLIVDGGLTF
ncbi:MAG: 3-oxoacyl-[acyl-carrier-protein] reductase, partial [Clostridia bacterium]